MSDTPVSNAFGGRAESIEAIVAAATPGLRHHAGVTGDEDLELLRAWQAGDVTAGRALIRRHYAPVYRFFFTKVDPTACEDLTQATFEVLCRRRDAFRGEGASFRGFVFGVARMKLIEHIRGKARRHFDPAGDSVVDPASLDSVSTLLAERQLEHLVAQALRELSLDDQIVLELKEYEQLTIRELAGLFDAPEGTIAGRIWRARQRLKAATERLVADPSLRAETERELESCMRSIGAKIAAHLGPRPGPPAGPNAGPDGGPGGGSDPDGGARK